MNWSELKRDFDGNILMVKGYKAFASDGTNMYGKTLDEGKKYHTDGEIVFGQHGNGLHLALYLQDCLRYCTLNSKELVENPVIAQVIATGKIIQSGSPDNDYTGYSDLFVCSDLEIKKYLSREEIIKYGLSLSYESRERFISYIQLSLEEMMLFWDKFGIGNIILLMRQFGLEYEEAKAVSDDVKILKNLYRR